MIHILIHTFAFEATKEDEMSKSNLINIVVSHLIVTSSFYFVELRVLSWRSIRGWWSETLMTRGWRWSWQSLTFMVSPSGRRSSTNNYDLQLCFFHIILCRKWYICVFNVGMDKLGKLTNFKWFNFLISKLLFCVINFNSLSLCLV